MGIRELIGAPDRPLMAHGPIVRLIVYIQAASVFIATVALIFAVALSAGKASHAYSRASANTARLQAIQESRHNAAFDQCYVLQHVVRGAFSPSLAHVLLKRNGLVSCQARARNLTQLPK